MLELEKISEKARSRDARFVSVGEKLCLQQLVAKHKDDYEAMARDRKTNADQRTAGELARAIRRAGGLSTMLNDG
jgi:nucleolar protein 16